MPKIIMDEFLALDENLQQFIIGLIDGLFQKK